VTSDLSSETLVSPVDAPARDAGELLTVQDLNVSFRTDDGELHPVRGTSWSVGRGETVVILGESGSGKSVSVHAIAGLLPGNATVSGSVKLLGNEMVGKSDRQLRQTRINDIGMIFQDPLSSLNPCFSVGDQVAEIFRVHRGLGRRAAMSKAVELFDLVKIPEPGRRARQYPHELSGGMRQRVMIAMAISLAPALLLADEPTTALDTSVRGAILRSVQDMRDELGLGVLLITHDVGVAAAVADRVAVMYAGRVVEYGSTEAVFRSPRHPYTAALLASMPRLDRTDAPLFAIKGTPPSLRDIPGGCAFAPRCDFARDICKTESPPLLAVTTDSTEGVDIPDPTGHVAACHFSEELHSSGALTR
jgi:peptide/nickel transport system ATP-binding protein